MALVEWGVRMNRAVVVCDVYVRQAARVLLVGCPFYMTTCVSGDEKRTKRIEREKTSHSLEDQQIVTVWNSDEKT